MIFCPNGIISDSGLTGLNNIYIYIYIYIYKTIFQAVNPELGTIPSRTIKIFKYRILNLSNPGQEIDANKIHRAIFPPF